MTRSQVTQTVRAQTLALVRPDARYRKTYLDALREFHAEGMLRDQDEKRLAADFARFVRELLSEADAAKCAPGRVPCSTFWLVDGEDFIGRVSLRHTLNDWLLQFGGHIGYGIRPSQRRQGYGTEGLRRVLPHAKALGLTRVLVTCDADNVGSRKIIEANGGVFENEIPQGGKAAPKRRYWIALL